MADIAKRIVVVDSGSTDRTVEIAESFGADVYHHIETNERGQFLYARQFLFGLNQTGINTTWVLRLDADERVTPGAKEELKQLLVENENTDVTGIIFRFEYEFMGKKLWHGGIYPFQKLLCFKYGKATIEDRSMDEHIILLEGRSVKLTHDCLHHDYKNLFAWTQKHNLYSDREADDYFAEMAKIAASKSAGKNGTSAVAMGADTADTAGQGLDTKNGITPNAGAGVKDALDARAKMKRFMKFDIYYKLPGGLRARLYYWYRYYLQLGFLDGREGKIFAFLQAYWYRYLVDAKIREREQQMRDQANQSK